MGDDQLPWEEGCTNYVLIRDTDFHVAVVRDGATEFIGKFGDAVQAMVAAKATGLPILNRFVRCVHCGQLNFEYYMVVDAVWLEASKGPLVGRLHLACLEKKLGRPLTIWDFSPARCNNALRFGYKMGLARG